MNLEYSVTEYIFLKINLLERMYMRLDTVKNEGK